MNKDKALSRQILLFMLSLTFTIIIVAVVGSYLFYSFIIENFPGGLSASNSESMTVFDWVWIAISSIISFLIALLFAFKLSAKILNPLSSVATSLRRISQGDLSARAANSQSSLGEVNTLVRDFNEMAEKLQTLDNQRKSWNAAIAHELRTPVTILRGRLQGLVEEVFEPDPPLFKSLLRQTEGLSRLIDDLRVVGAAEGGSFTLDVKAVAMSDVLENVGASFGHPFQEQGFNLIIEQNNAVTRCDPLRIIQCLTILFDNALNYATPGIVRVRSGYRDNLFFIEVEDTGPGVPDDFQRHMFEPFQRGAAGRAINPAGCGLGLSVAKAIMQAHGGDIRYRTSSQGGSLFLLRWPDAD
ncbi:ATP-binding protein [Pantoea ananatis]|uniref:histidine kinase n=2 Tax=Pantoea ananas TaxID=553 RepID=D4GKU7_PANAM|nr:ATP-binding protein [Pantoea ananatis]ADD78136.1 BaeS [Pantoea ananatis LMG 20103]AMB76841.1 histidine kinase [Pantoea ananatis]ERM12460.1 histidine kinase [Pantoea ananatis BRT175]MDQ1227042.1 two-component system sensor histidine kinase AdeS [Pantoea ananatis]MDR6092340.1 two-component system sensor histidine kinase AdeS [Pantoea ananatis]